VSENSQTLSQNQREEVLKVVADIAHQLAAPLTILMKRASSMPDEDESNKLKRQINHMTRLVSQIAVYARAGTLTLQPDMRFDLRDLVREVVEDQASFAAAVGKKLTCVDGGKKVEVIGDFNSAVEALSNVVNNAISHTQPGTMVTVSVQPDYTVAVLDRGAGVPESERELIFERLRQGRRPTEGGAGIGLAIVKDVMKAHGGTVSCSERAGGGSVFSLTFRSALAVAREAGTKNVFAVSG
jgi:two-component system, OmpR family, sensor kinase